MEGQGRQAPGVERCVYTHVGAELILESFVQIDRCFCCVVGRRDMVP